MPLSLGRGFKSHAQSLDLRTDGDTDGHHLLLEVSGWGRRDALRHLTPPLLFGLGPCIQTLGGRPPQPIPAEKLSFYVDAQ